VDAISAAQQLLRDIDNPTPGGLRELLTSLVFDPDDLEEVAGPAGLFPYGRKVICSTPTTELLVMNWAPRHECAPHDHGSSYGWIQIVDGTARHRLYTLDQHDVPTPYLQRTEHAGQLYFAPRGQIHQMGNPGEGRLLTLHLYAPPISGMHVYDLERCRVCVVSDDCGAWWPAEKRQLLRQRSFMRVGDRRDQRRAQPTL
jgi:cysteine dioxygenase